MYSNKDLNSGLYVYFQHTAIYPKTMLTGEDERLADMTVLIDCAYILTMRGNYCAYTMVSRKQKTVILNFFMGGTYH